MEEEPLIVAGVDIGAATAKALILNDDDILAFSIIPTGYSVTQAGESVIMMALIQILL